MKGAIETSLYASLAAQWITLFVNFWSFTLKLPDFDEILRTVLGIETFVQIVELIFYGWYTINLHKVAEITFYRYHDWVVTTPLMLFSTMIYYDYRNNPDEKTTLESFLEKHWGKTLIVFFFNLVMLGFGYAYERNLLDVLTANVLGFVGFGGSFYVIWDSFASKSPENYPLFFFMFGIWFLYGIASFFNPTWKNVSYNILDVFAKNFYGVFLSYLIYQKSIGAENKDVLAPQVPSGAVNSEESGTKARRNPSESDVVA
jgi:bacteriorhodopsin